MDGPFRYRHPIEVRYVDTDGLGHVNNATYLSYFEMARAGYHAALTGHPFGTGPDASRLTFVIAEAHIAYRAPAFFGEPVVCECRVSWASRSAFGLAIARDLVTVHGGSIAAQGGPDGGARIVIDLPAGSSAG